MVKHTQTIRVGLALKGLKISQNLQENTSSRACFLIKLQATSHQPPACNFILKETLAQVKEWNFFNPFYAIGLFLYPLKTS